MTSRFPLNPSFWINAPAPQFGKKKKIRIGPALHPLGRWPYVPLNLPKPKRDTASVAEEPEVAEPALAEGSGAY